MADTVAAKLVFQTQERLAKILKGNKSIEIANKQKEKLLQNF